MSKKTISAAYVSGVLKNENVDELKQLINDLLIDREFNLKQIELLQTTIDKKSKSEEK